MLLPFSFIILIVAFLYMGILFPRAFSCLGVDLSDTEVKSKILNPPEFIDVEPKPKTDFHIAPDL